MNPHDEMSAWSPDETRPRDHDIIRTGGRSLLAMLALGAVSWVIVIAVLIF